MSLSQDNLIEGKQRKARKIFMILKESIHVHLFLNYSHNQLMV